VINSAIALYYYVNIIRLMYLEAPQRQESLQTPPALRLAVCLCGVATVLLGLFPNTLLLLVRLAASVTLL
jgi:NADH-quinone oxidoreductase subunit N